METNPKDCAPAENLVFNHYFTAAITLAGHQVVFLKNVFTEENLNFLHPLLLGMPTTVIFLTFLDHNNWQFRKDNTHGDKDFWIGGR
jgi:hypothetical protein